MLAPRPIAASGNGSSYGWTSYSIESIDYGDDIVNVGFDFRDSNSCPPSPFAVTCMSNQVATGNDPLKRLC